MTLALDVVVRTLADSRRSSSLFRALDSIQSQEGIHARPIVVVNGQGYSLEVIGALERRAGVLVHFIPQASAGHARIAGHRLATAEFLSFLDDDDTFIEGALRDPLSWLAAHAQCDVVITNGCFVRADGQMVESTHFREHLDNPTLSLLDENWLSPGASIFRTRSVSPGIVEACWEHQEWTRLAFELCAMGKRLHFMDVPTVRYHDTPGSLSKKPRQQYAQLELLKFVRSDLRLDKQVRKKAERKYRNVLHVLAMKSWQEGRFVSAWRYHIASMRPPHTLKYLLSSRKLLWPVSKKVV